MPTEVISSVWDDLSLLTVEEAIAQEEWLADGIANEIAAPAPFDNFFETIDVNADVIGYRLAVAPRRNRKAEHVAEGSEIPVAGIVKDDYDGFAKIRKRAVGMRISWEEMTDNKNDQVRDRLRGQVASQRQENAEEAYETLEAADINTYEVLTPWNDGGDVAQGLVDMRALIKGAKDSSGNPLRYVPRFIIVNPMVTDSIITNETILKYYTGNMADKNPMLRGEADLSIFGNMLVLEDDAVPETDLWMGSTVKAGKLAQREEAWASPFLPEDGTDARGGARQTFRSNWSHRRAFYVPQPKSVVKATGVFG